MIAKTLNSSCRCALFVFCLTAIISVSARECDADCEISVINTNHGENESSANDENSNESNEIHLDAKTASSSDDIESSAPGMKQALLESLFDQTREDRVEQSRNRQQIISRFASEAHEMSIALNQVFSGRDVDIIAGLQTLEELLHDADLAHEIIYTGVYAVIIQMLQCNLYQTPIRTAPFTHTHKCALSSCASIPAYAAWALGSAVQNKKIVAESVVSAARDQGQSIISLLIYMISVGDIVTVRRSLYACSCLVRAHPQAAKQVSDGLSPLLPSLLHSSQHDAIRMKTLRLVPSIAHATNLTAQWCTSVTSVVMDNTMHIEDFHFALLSLISTQGPECFDESSLLSIIPMLKSRLQNTNDNDSVGIIESIIDAIERSTHIEHNQINIAIV